MAGEDDEVIVNLSGDTSTLQVAVEKTVPADKTGGGGESVSFNDDNDPVADLRQQFNQMSGTVRTIQAAHQQTEQQLQETTQRLQRAESTNQLDTIESGIAQVENDLAQAERALAAAFEAGDGAAVARAQRALARGETQLAQLGEARDSLRTSAQRQTTQQQPQRQQPRQAQHDPVEAVAANMSPKSAAWIRAHPDCITDQKKNARMLAAHHAAVADGIALDSDEYFDRIEKGVSPVQQQQKAPAKEQQQKEAGDGRRPSSAAASAAGAGGGMNGGSVSVKLTAREIASATDGTLVWNYDDPTGQNRFKKGDAIGIAEMARRKHEGQKAGLYDKNAFEA